MCFFTLSSPPWHSKSCKNPNLNKADQWAIHKQSHRAELEIKEKTSLRVQGATSTREPFTGIPVISAKLPCEFKHGLP